MRTAYAMAALTAAAMMPLPLLAQEETENGRFQLERMETGIVRLDTRSGALTLCQETEGNLVCRMAADERAAYEEELGRLRERVSALEETVGSGETVEKTLRDTLPDAAEIDRSFTIMEQMMRRFMGLAEEWNRDQPDDDAYPRKT